MAIGFVGLSLLILLFAPPERPQPAPVCDVGVDVDRASAAGRVQSVTPEPRRRHRRLSPRPPTSNTTSQCAGWLLRAPCRFRRRHARQSRSPHRRRHRRRRLRDQSPASVAPSPTRTAVQPPARHRRSAAGRAARAGAAVRRRLATPSPSRRVQRRSRSPSPTPAGAESLHARRCTTSASRTTTTRSLTTARCSNRTTRAPRRTTTSGCSYMDRGQLDDAVRQFERAIAIDARHVTAHNNLGVAFMRLESPRQRRRRVSRRADGRAP